MPKTPSNIVALGTKAPEFRLPDAAGKLHALSDYEDKRAVLVAFISNRCPFVVGIRSQLASFARLNEPRGLQIIAMNSNDEAAHPEETLARIGAEVVEQGYVFPYLKDWDQSVAHAYDAACTPDLYLFDQNRTLVYHGQFDGYRPGNDVPVTGRDIQAAVDALLDGQAPLAQQALSIGCNIKWKTEAEPNVRTATAAR